MKKQIYASNGQEVKSEKYGEDRVKGLKESQVSFRFPASMTGWTVTNK